MPNRGNRINGHKDLETSSLYPPTFLGGSRARSINQKVNEREKGLTLPTGAV